MMFLHKETGIEVEALRYSGSSTAASLIRRWIAGEPIGKGIEGGVHTRDLKPMEIPNSVFPGKFCTVFPNDWVVKGPSGFIAMSSNVFLQEYEPAPVSVSPKKDPEALLSEALQAMWDAYGTLGFDQDGDKTPAASLGDGGTEAVRAFISRFSDAIEEARKDFDEADEEHDRVLAGLKDCWKVDMKLAQERGDKLREIESMLTDPYGRPVGALTSSALWKVLRNG